MGSSSKFKFFQVHKALFEQEKLNFELKKASFRALVWLEKQNVEFEHTP